MLAIHDAIEMRRDEIPEDVNAVPVHLHNLADLLKTERQPLRLTQHLLHRSAARRYVLHQPQRQLVQGVDQLQQQLVVVLETVAEQPV